MKRSERERTINLRSAPRRRAARRSASQRNATDWTGPGQTPDYSTNHRQPSTQTPQERHTMQTYNVHLKSRTPISFGRYHNTAKNPREASDAFEERTWWKRLHFDANVDALDIPPPNVDLVVAPMAIKNMLTQAAQRLGMPVPGKARRTFTKIFQAGIMCTTPAPLGKTFADVRRETLFVSAAGKSGQGTGTRVMRHFPTIDDWSLSVEVLAVDPAITIDILQEHLDFAGKLVGLGRFRPENGGFYGMFRVESVAAA